MRHPGKFLVVVLALAVMHGCGAEEPSISDVSVADMDMKKDPGGGLQRSGGPYDWECSTLATCDTAFKNAKHGDVIYVHGGNTYTWSTMEEYDLDSTITIIGEDTTAVIKLTAGVGGETFFTFTDTPKNAFDLTIKSIKFVMEGSDAAFMAVSNYKSVLVEDCVMDRDRSNILQVLAKTFTMDGCRIRNDDPAFVHQNIDDFSIVGYTHVIKNSVLQADGGAEITSCDMRQHPGTITYEDDYFYGDASVSNFHRMKFSAAGDVLTINFWGNQLVSRGLSAACTPYGEDQEIHVNYNGNAQTTDPCNRGDLCPECDDYDIICTVTGMWDYNGDELSYAGFENISNQVACVYLDTAYVVFEVDSVLDNEDYTTVVARYGDTTCNAGASQATAWKHSTVSKRWCSKFYVGGFGTSFFWRGKAEFCDSIILGTCVEKSTRPCKDVPDWWEDYYPSGKKKK